MNKLLLLIMFFSSVLLIWCSANFWTKFYQNTDPVFFENSSNYDELSYDELNFLEDILDEKLSCNWWYEKEKTFISYAILELHAKFQAISINRNNYTALNVNAAIEKKQSPIEEQIKDFIKTDYLYFNKENDINQVFRNG